MLEFERVLCCPGCNRPADARVFGICSGFGPEQLQCARCKCIFPSGRTEWDHLTGAGLARFWIHSLIYAALLAAGGGMVSQMFFDIWRLKPKLAEDFTLKEMLPGAATLFALVAAIQIHRVRRSLRRTRREGGAPLFVNFWNLQISVQNKVRAFLALSLILGGFGLMLVRFGVIRF